jgi:hypothetical protein
MTLSDQLRSRISPAVRAAGVSPTARRIGVAHPVLFRWLSGHNTIGGDKLAVLAEIFGWRIIQKIEKMPETKGKSTK